MLKNGSDFLVGCNNISYLNILQDINLSIHPAETITIIGPNGAGKTTLLKIILQLIQPTAGSIKQANNLRIGYMPQRIFINNQMPIDVATFLQISSDKIIRTPEIVEALEKTRVLHTMSYAMQSLSGGELQKVLLARAWLRQPNLLVLDEPIQGVDINGQMELYQLILDIQQKYNCGVLMVSHDLHVVMARTNRVICLNRHICCQGTPDSVQQHPSYHAMFPDFASYTHHHDHIHI